MLDHLLGLTTAFRMAAEKVRPEAAERRRRNLATRLAHPAARAAGGVGGRVARAGAWDGMTEAGGVTMPAAAMGVVALNEVAVHGWDLAAATGQEYRPDPAGVQACLEMIGDRTDATDEPEGLFGPVVPGAGRRPVVRPAARSDRPRRALGVSELVPRLPVCARDGPAGVMSSTPGFGVRYAPLVAARLGRNFQPWALSPGFLEAARRPTRPTGGSGQNGSLAVRRG